MKNQLNFQPNFLNAIFIAVVAVVLTLACSIGGGQQSEANKIVDEANKKLEDTKVLYEKTEGRNTVLFSADIQTLRQFFAYKARMSGEAKSIVADYEKIAETMKDVSKQYDDISRMNLNEKYKDYAKLKSNEFAKRAEAITIRKGNAQAFNDIDDPRAMTAKFKENNAKSDQLFKDAEDIATKAKKIEEENKDVFKS